MAIAPRLLMSLCLALPLSAWSVETETLPLADLTRLPIERLLDLEVYGASRFAQKMSEAPSAVSVISAEDIRLFGYRTLADILRSVRGLHVTYDRNYSYLGVRGFGRPGDYNTRMLLLVDGYRVNDNIYDQAPIGAEFSVDVDLIDRVEFVPGPGSSIYGANAFFGVINVITKRGADFGGVQAAAEAGSGSRRAGRITYGRRGDDGADLLLSASGLDEDGRDRYFPEFDTPAANHGVARGLDYDRKHSLFAKYTRSGATLTFAHGERKKGVPTASFNQVFNDPRSLTIDRHTFLDGRLKRALGMSEQLSGRLYLGRYDFRGDYVLDYPPATLNRDVGHGRWWGAELKLVSTRWRGHKLVLGAEYQRDGRRDQANFDVAPHAILLNDRRKGHKYGLYLQDEHAVTADLLLNLGVRQDHDSTSGGATNPRLGLIYRLTPATSVKALYGTAYRAPNAYELDYAIPGPGGSKANPDLKAERIRSAELVLEHHFRPDLRLTASLFRNKVANLISFTTDPSDGLFVYRNVSEATARGGELELERLWSNGARLRTSYSRQSARDGAGALLVNAPRHLAKLNLSLPLAGDSLRTGLELQHVGRRHTLAGGATPAYTVANLTLLWAHLAPALELSASVYNLLDKAYADPGSEEHVQDNLAQDGRAFRVKLMFGF
ncbi:MAG: TonB-dependent receptor plug domain-containing protein [Pseudomonadota bacterium]